MEENNNQNNNDKNNGKKPGGYNSTLGVIIITVILSIIFIMAYNNYTSSGEEEVSYDKFIQMVDEGKVKNVEIYEQKIKFVPDEEDKKTENLTYYVIRTDDYELVDRLEKAKAIIALNKFKDGDHFCYITTMWGEQVEVKANFTGKIIEVCSQQGATVNKGDVLAYIEREA